MKKTAMHRTLLIMVGLVCVAATASAQNGPKFSLGYAYLKTLESGGGSAPVGAYVSLSGAGSTTLEIDGGYHRDEEGGATLKTFTVTGGPRFGFSDYRGGTGPFMHVLGGLRHDSFEGSSSTSYGGMAGVGVDLGTSASVAVRLGADFQIFWNHGENVKTLRLIAGLTF
jgi:hypothetical protein